MRVRKILFEARIKYRNCYLMIFKAIKQKKLNMNVIVDKRNMI